MDKRTWVVAIALAVGLLSPARAGVIFSQDFSSAPNGPTSTYVGNPPNAGQFNSINWTGKHMSVGVQNGALAFSRDGGDDGSFARTGGFAPIPTAMIYNFDLEVTGNKWTYTTAATWAVGSGFNTTTGLEPTANVHSRFAIDFTSTEGTYQMRTPAGVVSANVHGLKTITWVINNSGAALNYLAPDNTQHSLGDDTYDLWAGTDELFTGVAATSSDRPLTDLKFVYNNGYGTVKMDNFLIRTLPIVPEPSATGVLAIVFLAVVALSGKMRAKRN